MDKLERIKYLTDYLNQTTKEYDEGHPSITDLEWDTLYFELKCLENETDIIMVDSPTQVVNYQVVNSLEKVEHNHKMLSLDKTKDENEVSQFLENNNYLAMCKMDGLTCSVHYVNGKLVSAETRGNGIIGENILHNALVIPSIPNKIEYKDELIIDGEIICSYSDFESVSDTYKNPRNFASGSIRLLDSKECSKRKLQFIAWDVIKGFENYNLLSDKLYNIELLGFTVVPYTSQEISSAIEYIQEIAQEMSYPIDGVVFKFNDVVYGRSLGETAHHFKNAIAFKFYDETYPTTLLKIEWTMGRTGILTPVAVFDPIDADGSTIERASLHNVSVMEQLLGVPYIGQKMEIFKANMIIPQVGSAEKKDKDDSVTYLFPPAVCPICGEPIGIQVSDVSDVKNLVCSNPNCEGKLINQLDHFCGKKGLDIKGLSKATLEKLIDWGWVNSISDIFTLEEHKTDWIQKPGFGGKSVGNVLAAIEAAKTPTLDKFIASLGIPLIGSTVSKELIKHIKTYEEFREKAQSHFNFSTYDGFAENKTLAIWKYNFKEADKIYNNYLTIPEIVEETNSSESLKDITVVITGKLTVYKNRTALQAAIESAGGKVVGSVSKNTKYLINNDNTSTSSKNLTAQKLGVPIITEQEFIDKFLK